MIKYRFTGSYWDPKIEKYEIIKETPKTVTYRHIAWNGNVRDVKEMKDTSYYQWLDTFEEAKQRAIIICESRIEMLSSEIEDLSVSLEKIKAWKDE